ncbi:uncharacterized protein PHALS_15449 [Plasmopara halstedii]|uniref:Uncharacterized protein n=1 Tax=Plasmopara halstedii TaxID=4781 RepID=A0A0N7L549_PLAHL|nr:uncharacterized protein PHALS_15449 [Plasmopara halstedii]CEG40483.1 hypothetical protein PHALS_15449 [Plasmopara halstedii]|eukprot:XP_024576852.1 hypothetical protein PHALS_15449 [Plasmopara halstedii]
MRDLQHQFAIETFIDKLLSRIDLSDFHHVSYFTFNFSFKLAIDSEDTFTIRTCGSSCLPVHFSLWLCPFCSRFR